MKNINPSDIVIGQTLLTALTLPVQNENGKKEDGIYKNATFLVSNIFPNPDKPEEFLANFRGRRGSFALKAFRVASAGALDEVGKLALA